MNFLDLIPGAESDLSSSSGLSSILGSSSDSDDESTDSPFLWNPIRNSEASSSSDEDTDDTFDDTIEDIIEHSPTSGPPRRVRLRALNRQRQLEEQQAAAAAAANISASEMIEESNRNSVPNDESPNHGSEPPAKVRKLETPQPDDSDNEGETCPICLESWGNSGEHRLVSLKCGHLFGSKCVDRWIRSRNHTERSCPTCKTKAAVKDIRYIYAKRLVAVDTTELTALQVQMETVLMEKHHIQMELQTTKLEHRSMALQLDLLRKNLATTADGKQGPRRSWRFALEKNLKVWRDGGCRVLAYNCRTYEFYVSQKTTSNLFPGYGVRPVSCVDYKLGPFIPLHPKAIRDVAYSQPTDLLMSVGLDGAVKIVERGIPTTSIQCGMPLWSCAWDYARPNHFYVGGVGGVVLSYDVRNTNAVVDTISTPGDMSPNVSLVSTEFGLLACQLNSAWLWKNGTLAGGKPQPLPLNGPYLSLTYDQESKRVAVSCRSSSTERAKVALFKVSKSASNDVCFDMVDNMQGSSFSSVMSRAAFIKCADSVWVGAYSESDASLILHPVDGSRHMVLPTSEPTLDVCAGQVNGETILAALSDSRLRLYKSLPANATYT